MQSLDINAGYLLIASCSETANMLSARQLSVWTKTHLIIEIKAFLKIYTVYKSNSLFRSSCFFCRQIWDFFDTFFLFGSRASKYVLHFAHLVANASGALSSPAIMLIR